MKEFFTSRFQTIAKFLKTQSIPTADWLNIFRWSFWQEPGLTSNSTYALFSVVVVALVIASLVIWRWRLNHFHQLTPVYGQPRNQLANLIAFLIIMTISYGFFRAQEIE